MSAGATAANITATEPAGAALDDILKADLYIESVGTVTPPAGWSNVFNGTTMMAACVLAGSAFRFYSYYIRRGGSAPALQWTFASAFRYILVAAYSGAINSGDPWSFGANAVRDSTASKNFPAVSGTTDSTDELLVWAGSGFDCNGAGTPPTSFTERVDSATFIELADLAQAVAGSTGSVSGASYAGGTNNTTAVSFGGLKSTAAAGAGQPTTKRMGGVPFMGGSGGGNAGAFSGGFRWEREGGLYVPSKTISIPRRIAA